MKRYGQHRSAFLVSRHEWAVLALTALFAATAEP